MKTKEELLKIYSAYLPYEFELEVLKKGMYFPYPNHLSAGRRIVFNVDQMPFKIWCNPTNSDWLDILFRDTKPVLYSMDMLTKEIEYKEERFIPLIKLYGEEIVLFNARKRNAKIECKVIKTAHDEFDYSLFIDDKMVFKYATYIGYEVGSFFQKNAFITNPFYKYQKLFEWHFNVFGLDESEYIKKEIINER